MILITTHTLDESPVLHTRTVEGHVGTSVVIDIMPHGELPVRTYVDPPDVERGSNVTSVRWDTRPDIYHCIASDREALGIMSASYSRPRTRYGKSRKNTGRA